MKQQCFSIVDVKVGYFNVPFFSPTLESGKRAFAEVVRDKTTLPGKYPEDFALYHIGEFDDIKGVLVGQSVPVVVLYATEIAARDAERVVFDKADLFNNMEKN